MKWLNLGNTCCGKYLTKNIVTVAFIFITMEKQTHRYTSFDEPLDFKNYKEATIESC